MDLNLITPFMFQIADISNAQNIYIAKKNNILKRSNFIPFFFFAKFYDFPLFCDHLRQKLKKNLFNLNMKI